MQLNNFIITGTRHATLLLDAACDAAVVVVAAAVGASQMGVLDRPELCRRQNILPSPRYNSLGTAEAPSANLGG